MKQKLVAGAVIGPTSKGQLSTYETVILSLLPSEKTVIAETSVSAEKIYQIGFICQMKVDEKELNKLRKIGESMNVSRRTIKIWEKNLKQGYRFFQPHNAIELTPRTEREANANQNLRKQMREVQKSR